MKILLCTDGSRNGLSAVRLGGAIAASLEADITLLCVVDADRRDPERALQRSSRAMQELGVKFRHVLKTGDFVDELLAHLLGEEYNLVVVGYYVRKFWEKMVWGSLASRIAQELPVSVLIVRDWRKTIARILLGISAGGFTEQCLDWGGIIAAAFDATAILLHVSAAPPLMYAGLEDVAETLTEFLQADTPDAQAMHQAVAHMDEVGVQADVELARGIPERELLRVSQDQDVDLLVVGSPWAVRPWQRALRRNVAEKVLLNTRRPVLIVRPRE